MNKDLKLHIMLKAVDKVTRPFRGIIQSAEKMRGQMATTGAELKSLHKTQASISSFKSLQKELKHSAQALTQKRENARQLEQQLTSTQKPTQKLRNAFLKAKDAANKAEQAHRNKRESLARLSTTLKQTGIDVRHLSTEEQKLASNVNKVNDRLNTQANRLENIRKKTNAVTKARQQYDKATQRHANLGITGAAGVATGSQVLTGIGEFIQPGIAFEKQMSKVGALARLEKTSQAFIQLRQQAERLGASTEFSATQAGQGMQFLAMAGFNARDILASMPSMLNLNYADGNTELKETADIASNILSGFKLQADQMPKVADVLTATLTRSNVDLRMLGETMTYVAPIASKFGASIEEASALAGMLGNVGIQGSMAGTAMRTMYNNIASHAPAINALEELGIQSRLDDGNMRALPEILSEIAKKTESMGSGQQLEIFKLIAGKEAGAAFAELVSQSGSEGITQFMDVLHRSAGEARRVASQMSDNTAGDIKAMQSAWEGLNISVAGTNTAPMRDMIQSVTRVINRVNMWVQQNPELAGQLLRVVAIVAAAVTVGGALALAIAGTLGPMAMMIYSMRLMWIQTLATSGAMARFILFLGGGVLKAVASIARITKATWLMNIALNANPIGLIITGIAALIGMGWMLYKNWGKVTESLGKGFDWLREKFSWIDKTAKVVSGLWDAVFGNEEAEKTLKLNQHIQREQVDQANALKTHFPATDTLVNEPQINAPHALQEKTAQEHAAQEQRQNIQETISPAKKAISGTVLAAGLVAPAFADSPVIDLTPSTPAIQQQTQAIAPAQTGLNAIQSYPQPSPFEHTSIVQPSPSNHNVTINYGDVNIYTNQGGSNGSSRSNADERLTENHELVALIREELDRREAQALSRARSRLYD